MKKNVEPEFPLLSTSPRGAGQATSSRARVLIAEDDYALRDLPRWSGLTTLEKLGHSPRVPPVAVTTALGSDAIHRQATQAGAVAVLDRPFDVQELIDLGRHVLAQSRPPVGARPVGRP